MRPRRAVLNICQLEAHLLASYGVPYILPSSVSSKP